VIAEYDSQADALSIDLIDDLKRLDHAEEVEGTSAIVHFLGEEIASVELLGASVNQTQLETAASGYSLDGDALLAAAAAALAAPDRPVRLEVGAPA
jgi:hypothetical protein